MRFEIIYNKKEKQAENRKRDLDVSDDVIWCERIYGFFKVDDLIWREINILRENGYKIAYQTDLYGKKNHYLIRPPENESMQHFVLVHIIKKVLENNFEYVKSYYTKEPDIVFRVRNRFIALEIETGKVLSKNKKRFLEKISSIKENYGDDWFIVVTNRNFVGKYRKFGKTVSRKNFLKKVSSYVGFDIK